MNVPPRERRVIFSGGNPPLPLHFLGFLGEDSHPPSSPPPVSRPLWFENAAPTPIYAKRQRCLSITDNNSGHVIGDKHPSTDWLSVTNNHLIPRHPDHHAAVEHDAEPRFRRRRRASLNEGGQIVGRIAGCGCAVVASRQGENEAQTAPRHSTSLHPDDHFN